MDFNNLLYAVMLGVLAVVNMIPELILLFRNTSEYLTSVYKLMDFASPLLSVTSLFLYGYKCDAQYIVAAIATIMLWIRVRQSKQYSRRMCFSYPMFRTHFYFCFVSLYISLQSRLHASCSP